jgi:hypothetical protein
VFPLSPGSKKPAFPKWNWTEGATDDAATITTWSGRDYNYGVLTDGRIVADVDVKNGRPGMQSLLSIVDLDELDTLTVRTPSGGKHLYYDGPNRSLSTGACRPASTSAPTTATSSALAPGSTRLPENKGVGGAYTSSTTRRCAASRLDPGPPRRAAGAPEARGGSPRWTSPPPSTAPSPTCSARRRWPSRVKAET